MFIDFVTYLEIRDDLSKEDEQYINSEIERYMVLCQDLVQNKMRGSAS